MVYITGDCHGNFERFSSNNFPGQREMTRDDFVIVCGDFGLWDDNQGERWWLKWLEEKNFTLLWCDGNHENFDRLYSDEFEVVDFHGGKAHKIKENVYHLMRGYVFDLCEKKFFVFGGAKSHDIRDGVLNIEDFKNKRELSKKYMDLVSQGKSVRINHVSWWEQEMPTDEEMKFGLETLNSVGNRVDYIVTHCCPQEIASVMSNGAYSTDKLTEYFNKIANKVDFSSWFFGHYHKAMSAFCKYICVYEKIIRIL